MLAVCVSWEGQGLDGECTFQYSTVQYRGVHCTLNCSAAQCNSGYEVSALINRAQYNTVQTTGVTKGATNWQFDSEIEPFDGQSRNHHGKELLIDYRNFCACEYFCKSLNNLPRGKLSMKLELGYKLLPGKSSRRMCRHFLSVFCHQGL